MGNFLTQFFPRTKLVRDPVFPRISQFLTFNLFYHLDVYTTMRYVGFLGPSIFPDAGIRIYGQKSGFPKSAFLESTCYGEFFDTIFFPDKISPGSGFYPDFH